MILEIFSDSVKAVKRNGLKRTMKQIFVFSFYFSVKKTESKQRVLKSAKNIDFWRF